MRAIMRTDNGDEVMMFYNTGMCRGIDGKGCPREAVLYFATSVEAGVKYALICDECRESNKGGSKNGVESDSGAG